MALEVKICGLTRLEDARRALELGVDYVGFVLYGGSPRGITVERARDILAGLEGERRAVGVFVNASRPEVEDAAADCGLWAVQLHGDEDASEFAGLTVEVWRAVRYRDGGWRPRPEEWPAARYVVDAAAPGVYGGTGRAADWDKAAELARRREVMLAGGLGPGNVAEAIERVRPLGVDTASGVEAAPGVKDAGKMAAFVRVARGAPGAARGRE